MPRTPAPLLCSLLCPLLSSLLLALAVAGCGPDAPVADGPPPAPAEPAPPELAKLTGTVRYERRLVLATNSVIDVELVRVRPDADAERVGQHLFYSAGKQVPIAFKVSYDPTLIDPQGDYEIRARITNGDRTTYLTQHGTPVLTKGNPKEGLDIVLLPAP